MKKGDLTQGEVNSLNPSFREGEVKLLFITAWEVKSEGSDVMLEPGTERRGLLTKDLELGGQIWIKKQGVHHGTYRTKYITRIYLTEDGRLILENYEKQLYLLEKVRPGDN